ncbi:DUF131 domain-containing protein [Candidatus Woesearchaeota archaeon]|nr:DUF131 domain-containing protein [Candidatus Woesearchaeota archaeon]
MPFKMEQLISLGILLMIIGFLIVFFGMLMGTKEPASKAKVAVGGFIGPIPFGFGNDRNLLWFVTILSIVLFLVWIFFSFRFMKQIW